MSAVMRFVKQMRWPVPEPKPQHRWRERYPTAKGRPDVLGMTGQMLNAMQDFVSARPEDQKAAYDKIVGVGVKMKLAGVSCGDSELPDWLLEQYPELRDKE
jgi:hypothetical protein